MTAPLLIWGFEGTVDYRASLTAEEFGELGMTPPYTDGERFMSRGQLQMLMAKVESLKGPAQPSVGGSPLIGAVAASEAASFLGPPCETVFVGNLPGVVRQMMPCAPADITAFAHNSIEIASTVSLEYAPATAKLMLAVPDGRWLDGKLAAQAAGSMGVALTVSRAECAMLAIGGLNKSEPSVASQLVREFRSAVRRPALFVCGNSFAPEATRWAGYAYWSDLFQLMAVADFISVSSDEDVQLSGRWGDSWKASLLKWSTRAIFIHSGDGIEVMGDEFLDHSELRRLAATAFDLEGLCSGSSITARRARLDGVLSALLVTQLAESSWLHRLSAAPVA